MTSIFGVVRNMYQICTPSYGNNTEERMSLISNIFDDTVGHDSRTTLNKKNDAGTRSMVETETSNAGDGKVLNLVLKTNESLVTAAEDKWDEVIKMLTSMGRRMEKLEKEQASLKEGHGGNQTCATGWTEDRGRALQLQPMPPQRTLTPPQDASQLSSSVASLSPPPSPSHSPSPPRAAAAAAAVTTVIPTPTASHLLPRSAASGKPEVHAGTTDESDDSETVTTKTPRTAAGKSEAPPKVNTPAVLQSSARLFHGISMRSTGGQPRTVRIATPAPSSPVVPGASEERARTTDQSPVEPMTTATPTSDDRPRETKPTSDDRPRETKPTSDDRPRETKPPGGEDGAEPVPRGAPPALLKPLEVIAPAATPSARLFYGIKLRPVGGQPRTVKVPARRRADDR